MYKPHYGTSWLPDIHIMWMLPKIKTKTNAESTA